MNIPLKYQCNDNWPATLTKKIRYYDHM